MKERKLSNTDINKVIMEKIPIKSRIDSVYLPIFAIFIAEDAYKTLHDDLIIIGNKETREFDRQISNTFRRYQASNMKAMGGELYCCVMRNSEKLFQSIRQTLSTMRRQFYREMQRQDMAICSDRLKTETVAECAMIDCIMGYVMTTDSFYAAQFQKLIGDKYRYEVKKDVDIDLISHCLKDIAMVIGDVFIDRIGSKDIDTSKRIFATQMNSLNIIEK